MPLFIILSQENRGHVAGQSLNPIERVPNDATPDPVYILNMLVLSDPAHAAFAEYLAALPQMEAGDPEFPLPIEPVDA